MKNKHCEEILICKFREKQISSGSHREKDLLQSNVRQLVYGKLID
jgi:hypothetical protein